MSPTCTRRKRDVIKGESLSSPSFYICFITSFKTKVTSRLAEYLSILFRYHHEERIFKKFFLFLFSAKTFFSNFFFFFNVSTNQKHYKKVQTLVRIYYNETGLISKPLVQVLEKKKKIVTQSHLKPPDYICERD